MFQKNCINNISSKNQKRQRVIALILVNTIQYPRTLKNNIYYSSKRIPPPFFHSDTNPVFCHVLIHSLDKTHVLVVTVKLIWSLLLNILSFNFVRIFYFNSGRLARFRRSYVKRRAVVPTSNLSPRRFCLIYAAQFKVATFLIFAAVCPR